MTKHIIVSDEARKKLERLKISRPQDNSIAQTIDYLIYSNEEKKFKPDKVKK